MRLAAYTDYALRVLIRLALQPERLTTIADIAKGYGISENHLMKVVHQLGVAGFIDTGMPSGRVSRWAQPALFAQYSQVRQVSTE
jgi:Rrf2 family nitric oxide-sensitive transcriptional repressor